MLHFFRVTIYFCCTLIKLHDIHVTLFWCCNCPFCTLYMLHSFHVALSSCCINFTLHFFRVALFSCCTLFMLHSFHVAPFYVLHFFHVALFFVLLQVALFYVALILYCTFSVLRFIHLVFSSCGTILGVAFCSSCTHFLLLLFLCCTYFVLHFLCCHNWRMKEAVCFPIFGNFYFNFILLLPPFWKFSKNKTLSTILYRSFILCKMKILSRVKSSVESSTEN